MILENSDKCSYAGAKRSYTNFAIAVIMKDKKIIITIHTRQHNIIDR
jgi:hypothetical protein